MIAINDSFMLEGTIYFLLKKHFRKESYYIDLVDLYHEVTAPLSHSVQVLTILGNFSNGARATT